jgi:hypothetical protein
VDKVTFAQGLSITHSSERIQKTAAGNGPGTGFAAVQRPAQKRRENRKKQGLSEPRGGKQIAGNRPGRGVLAWLFVASP